MLPQTLASLNARLLSIALSAFTAALVLLAAFSPASDAAVLKGLQDQEMSMNKPALRTEFFTRAKESGSTWVRFNPRWDGKSTVPEQFQIDQIKAFAQVAPTYGVTTIMLAPKINGTEVWNPKGTTKTPKASKLINKNAYRLYIRNIATQLKDVALTKWYAPINEPNWYRHLPRRGGPAMYRALHRIAWNEVKAADPKALVLFGELAPFARPADKNYPRGMAMDPGKFVRAVLNLNSSWKGVGKKATYAVKADGIGLHTYTFDFKDSPTTARANRDWFVHGNLKYAIRGFNKVAASGRITPKAANTRIYLTEFAYKTKGAQKISASKASKYLKSAWASAKKYKAKSFLWYQLRDPSDPAEAWQSGLMKTDGSPYTTWNTFKALKP